MQQISVVPLNLQTADMAVLRALNQHQDLMRAELQPADPPVPLASRLAGWRNESTLMELGCWVVFTAADRQAVAGNAWAEVSLTAENGHIVHFNIMVLPDYRRRGLGRALLAALADYAEAAGRTTLYTGTRSTVPAGERFMARLGASKGLESTTNQLDLAAVDWSLVEGWLQRSQGLAPEYVLEFWEGAYPDHLLDGRVKLHEAMKDAPTGDLSTQTLTTDVAERREVDRSLAARGITRWTTYVRHQPTGEFAGFSELLINPTLPTILEQGETGVLPAHRKRGLGRWVKAAMLARVRADLPAARYIRTNNATTNAPMLKINHELGFRPYTHDAWWEISLAQVKAYLGC